MGEQVKYFDGDAEIVKDLEEDAQGLVMTTESARFTPLQQAAPTLIFCGMFFAAILGALALVINAFH